MIEDGNMKIEDFNTNVCSAKPLSDLQYTTYMPARFSRTVTIFAEEQGCRLG